MSSTESERANDRSPSMNAENAANAWAPPMNFRETLKHYLIPGRLYIWLVANKVLRRARRDRTKGELELTILSDLVDPRRMALDVGANRGVYSYFLSRLCPRVVAFEPNPKMLVTLRKNAARNVTVEAVALSDKSARAELNIPRSSHGYSNQCATLNTRNSDQRYGTVEVQSKRLDEYSFDDVGFIKIDVEGHELAVLEGAQDTLARCRPNLLIEIEESHIGFAIEDAIGQVCQYGYDAYALIKTSTDIQLTPVGDLDFDRVHRNGPRSEYLFNFIFLPVGAVAPTISA